LEKQATMPLTQSQPVDDFPIQPRSGRKLRVAAWIGAALLICAAIVGLFVRRAKAGPQVQYDTADVDRGTIAAKITATGSLAALLTVQVGSQVSGRVQKLYVDYNSPVKKGQPVASLDPLLFDAAVKQTTAMLLSAKSTLGKDQAQLVNAKLIFDRTQKLMNEKIVAQSDLDTAQANYDAAKAQVDADQSNLQSAQAALDQAQVNRDYTTIVSPIDGTVIARDVDVGQTVAASFQAPTLFVIAQDLRRMQVDTNVGEADVGRLREGMSASFTVDAYPNKPFVGRLRQIRNASQTLQNVVTYDAVIDVENPKLQLKPGMTANVTFVANQKDNVVRLRNAALRFQPDPQLLRRIGITPPAPPTTTPPPNHATVWVLRNGKPILVDVILGVTDGTWTELVSGDIQPSDKLITDMNVGAPRGLFQ
jgi:HlyD family secretion protein